MTDKELLELAAKAAGIKIMFWSGRDVGRQSAIIEPDGLEWNPLTDDGDALRLAVRLGLDVCIDLPQENNPHTHVIGFLDQSPHTVDAVEKHGDSYAATRRAIVRAASSIGKTK